MQRHALGHAWTGAGSRVSSITGRCSGSRAVRSCLAGGRGEAGSVSKGWLGRCLRFGARFVLHALQEHLQLGRVDLLALASRRGDG